MSKSHRYSPVYTSCIASILLSMSACTHQLIIGPEVEYENTSLRFNGWARDLGSWLANNDNFGAELLPMPPLSTEWIKIMSFVHVSDVQIRDAKLRFALSWLGTTIPDDIAGGVERPRIDEHDEYPFVALVGAINKLAPLPAFLIHTGDALDVGTHAEFMRFLGIANNLKIPWFGVIGNHDHWYMGTFREGEGLVTIGHPNRIELMTEAYRFSMSHGMKGKVGGILDPSPGSKTALDPHYTAHDATERFSFSDPSDKSMYHGFDLGPFGRRSRYYSFALIRDNITFRFIILDTTLQSDRSYSLPHLGAKASIDHDQFTWLEDQLENAFSNQEKVFLFGHHPLSEEGQDGQHPATALVVHRYGGSPQTFLEYLQSRDCAHVLAYFCGHTHRPRIYPHPRTVATPLLEVVAPSLHECPQFGFFVSVYRSTRSQNLALAVQAFRGSVQKCAPKLLFDNWAAAVIGAIQESIHHGFQDQLKHLSPDGMSIIPSQYTVTFHEMPLY